MNLYAYVGGNPVNFNDPSGLAAAQAKLMASQYGPGAAEFALGFIPGYDLYSAATNPNATGWDYAAGIAGIFPGAGKGAGLGLKAAGKIDNVSRAAKGSSEAIQVTKGGIALPPGAKYQIPDGYVQNPHRSGSYGEVVDGKFKERLRIDPPTPPGQKGPNYSHYHRDGKGTHYSPRPGDKDPGFEP